MSYINIADLTSTTDVDKGIANGSGVFDKLMNSVNLYLDDQYTSGRLKGTDYANVLLGSIQTVLTQSVQFVLQEKLIEAQIDDVQAGIALKNQQKSNLQAEALNIPKQGALIDAQKILTTSKNTTEGIQQNVLGKQAALYETQATAFKKKQNKEVFDKLMDTDMMGAINTVTDSDAYTFANTTRITAAYNQSTW